MRAPVSTPTGIALLVAVVASLNLAAHLDWAVPRAQLIPLLFGSRAELAELTPSLSASKGLVDYDQVPQGAAPLSVLHAKVEKMPAHVLLQMRGYLLKTRTFDESKTFNALSSLTPERFDPEIFIYGGAYLFSIASLLAAGDLLGLLEAVGDRTYYQEHPAKMGALYVTARLASALPALALVALCGWIVAHRSPVGGVVAGLLVAFSPEMTFAAHVAKPHALAAFLAFAALAAAMRGGRRSWTLAAVLAGIATAASVVYGVFVLGLMLLALYRRDLAGAVRMLVVGAIAFLASNPHVLVFPNRFLETVTTHHSQYAYGQIHFDSLWRFVYELGSFGIGWGGVVLALIGATWTGAEGRRWAYWLGASVLLFGAALGVLRIGLVIVPLAAVVAGYGAGVLAARAREGDAWRAAALAAIVLQASAAMHFATLSRALASDADPRRSPGLRAGRWINQHVDAGSSIALEDTSSWTDTVPPFRFLKYRLEPHGGGLTDYVVVSEKCEREVSDELRAYERAGFETVAAFSSCIGTYCNCRFQTGLGVWILGRTPAAIARAPR